MLSAGGVPLLVHGLEHADTEVAGHCSEMLARLSSSSAAQAAIRCVVMMIHCCKACATWVRSACHKSS